MHAEDARGVLGYARYRGRAVALAFAVAVAGTVGAAAVPPQTESGIAELLSRGVGGSVEPKDFVWEPSRGWFLDAFVGRRVLFLAKKAGRLERELYRGLVTVTPGGRPLALRASAPLTLTDLADESSLLVARGRAVVRLDALGADATHAIEIVDLASSADGKAPMILRDVVAPLLPSGLSTSTSSRRLVFERPQRSPAFEIQGDDLVVALDGGAAAMVDPAGRLSFDGDGAIGPFVVEVREAGRVDAPTWRRAVDWGRSIVDPSPQRAQPVETDVVNRVSPRAARTGAVDLRFPPADWAPVDAHPGCASTSKGDLHVVAIDTRRFSLALVAGRDAARSRTGHVASGRLHTEGPIEAAFRVPIAADAGAWDRGALVAPLRAERDTVSESQGKLAFGALPDGVDAPEFAVQWAPEIDDVERPRSQLCVTRSGHVAFVFGTGTSAALNAVTGDLDCAYASPAGAPASDGVGGAWFDEAGATTAWPGATADIEPLRSGAAGSYLVAQRRVTEPTVKPPDEQGWSPVAAQPEPSSIPAIYEASVDKLGTTVHVHLFMPGRFDWAIRAGDEEKQHRFGGTFERALDAKDVDRVFFTAGLGVGKRQDPLGLKIAGVMGHRFHAAAGLIAAHEGALVVGASADVEPSTDASEGVVAARHGALTREARDSGPRQSRADVCALEDGSVLVAEAVFDNHEASASTLVEMGCSFVVSLDRGADRAAWTRDRSDDEAVERATSVLFALSRPFPGSLQP